MTMGRERSPVLIDIYDALKMLTASLETHGVEYAVCGGLAMAVHGYVRATVDIDILISPDELKSVLKIAQGLGYEIKAKPMKFADGKVIIYRVTKIFSESKDYLPVDLILVTDEIRSVWESRKKVKLEDGSITVVSRQGLIQLKHLRGSKQDLADIERLEGKGDES